MAMFMGSSHFPFKVHAILERNYECIQWCGSTSFRLIDTDAFVTGVLPKFFKHEKLSSFTRQLNIYGFHKIREGPLKGAYTHEDFVRGDLERVSSIPRTKRSGPREVMKIRESRNASVIYSSMMKGKSKLTEDESSRTDYSSDGSRTGLPAVKQSVKQQQPKATTHVAPCPCNVETESKKRKMEDTENESSLLGLLRGTRFSYKEWSYDELKSQNIKTEPNVPVAPVAKRVKHEDAVQYAVKQEAVSNPKPELPSNLFEHTFREMLLPSPEFESDLSEYNSDEDVCDFSTVPTLKRSITQQQQEQMVPVKAPAVDPSFDFIFESERDNYFLQPPENPVYLSAK